MFSHKGLSIFAIRHLRPSSVLRKLLLYEHRFIFTLYNHCLEPILLYGSEVWSVGFLIHKPGLTRLENRNDLLIPDKNQLKFFKKVRGVLTYSVNDAVRAEFGAVFNYQFLVYRH